MAGSSRPSREHEWPEELSRHLAAGGRGQQAHRLPGSGEAPHRGNIGRFSCAAEGSGLTGLPPRGHRCGPAAGFTPAGVDATILSKRRLFVLL